MPSPFPVVLVVDASPAAQRLCALALEGIGVVVRSVPDGTTAMTEVRAERPAAVVVDRALPDMDGYALAEALHRDGRGAAAPVVLLVGPFEVIDDARLAACRGVTVLRKPVAAADLQAAIRPWLPVATAHGLASAPRAVGATGPVAEAALVDAVTARVLDALRGGLLEATVAAHVDDVAERLVREEIARITENIP